MATTKNSSTACTQREKLNRKKSSKSFNLGKFFKSKDVTWVKLSDLVNIRLGESIKAEHRLIRGKYHAFGGGKNPMFMCNEFNFPNNTITITRVGTAGLVSLIEEDFWLTDNAYGLTLKRSFLEKNNLDLEITNKVLFYFLKDRETTLQHTLNKGTIPNLSLANLKDIHIPVLQNQEAITLLKILDNYEELINNLKLSIIENNKQAIYYRDYLLSRDILEKLNSKINTNNTNNTNNTTVKAHTFKDLVQFRSGSDVRKFATSDENSTIAVFGGSGKQQLRVNEFSYDQTTVIIPQTGDLDLAWFVEEPFWAMNSAIYTVFKTDNLLPKYFYYVVKSKRLSRFNIYRTRPTLNHTVLNKIPIDLPPLNVQQYIIHILDQFEQLDQNLTQELAARTKQYQYYRRVCFNYFKPVK